MAHDMDGNELWVRKFDDRSMNFGTGSSPVIHDGNVYFLRDTPKQSELVCLDVTTGDEVWVQDRDVRKPSFSTPCVWQHNGVTEIVVAGSGKLDAYDADSGKHIWTINGIASLICPSPVTLGETLVFGAWTTGHVAGAERIKSSFSEGEIELSKEELEDPEAFLKRFDKDRNGSISVEEFPQSRFKEAYRFFDADSDGELRLQEFRGFFKGKASPGRNVMLAVRAGGRGDISETHVMWETTKFLSYVASPVIHDGRVFCVKQGGVLTSWDLSTGKMGRPMRLGTGGEYYATPVVVGNRLVVAAERGKVLMLSLGDRPRLIAENDFGDNIFATPAVAGNRLYLRTATHLYAIGR